MVAKLDIEQGHWTQFWNRIVEGVSHLMLVQFGPVIPEKKTKM
jgi:hypothetical protein